MKLWRQAIVGLAVTLLLSPALAENAKNVFVLHMESSRLPANIAAAKAILETIGREPGTQIFEEYMDENRLPADYPALAERISEKYAGKKMNVIMTVGPRAFGFMMKYREQLFPNVPIVFSVIGYRGLPAQLPQNVTGVSNTSSYASTVDLILKLQPDTQRIFLVAGSSADDISRRNGVEAEFRHFAGRVGFVYLEDLPLPELLGRLGQLPSHSVVLFSTYFMDATGQPYMPQRICPLIVASSNAPVYGTFETLLGYGIVGGSLLQVEASAGKAAGLALQVLNGRNVASLPVEPAPRNEIAVDWRQLKKWNISESQLPAGTAVMYRELTAWELYRKYVWAGIAILGLQSALIILLMIQRRRRKRSDQAVRLLTGRLIHASEEERRHIARELHDDIGQRLSLVSVQLGMSGNQLPADAVESRAELDHSVVELDTLISDVHNLSHRLHSSKLEHLGLEAAMKDLCQEIGKRHGLQIDLEAQIGQDGFASDVPLCFYRVAQEALNNVVKHSNATRAQVTLTRAPGTLRMRVQDWGRGFKTGDVPAGLGLTAMQERLRDIGGRLCIESKSGEGTVVIAEAAIPTSDGFHPNRSEIGRPNNSDWA
jgi:signal transduction histidine kinase